jgi:hypothetical protein
MDTVGFYDCCFIVLVFTQHYLLTQGAQLYKLYLQLGGQVLCFLLGAGYEIFLVLNKPLSCSNSLFKAFQLPRQKFKSLGAHRGISLSIQSRLLVIDYSAPFGNISFQGGMLVMFFNPTMSFFHFGPKERKMSDWPELDLKNFRELRLDLFKKMLHFIRVPD